MRETIILCTLALALACSAPDRPDRSDRSGRPDRSSPSDHAGDGPAGVTPAAGGSTSGRTPDTSPAAALGEPRLLDPAPWPADEGIGTLSNGGRYWVVYLPSEREIPLNEEFDVEVRVFDGETRSRLVEAEVAIDARMPAHGHGMKLDPPLTRSSDGSYEAPGMLLHMVGHWELYVDLTVGPITERAQFDIELE